MKLDGKRVLVTGGARRVGAGIVRAFAARGASVVIHCNSAGAEADRLLKSLPGAGHTVLAGFDFTRPGEADRLFAAATISGPLDILVNNASVYRLNAPGSAAVYEAVNFAAPELLTRRMAEQSGGGELAVIDILDDEAVASDVPDSDYLASRRKLLAALKRDAPEYARRGLRLNAAAPGPMLPPVGLENSKMTKMIASIPLGRRIDPGDLAAAVIFLAENSSIAGAVLPVDGARHCR